MKCHVRIIGLSATLRPVDIADIMRRISIDRAVIYRQSCYRENLQLVFEQKDNEQEVLQRVTSLVVQHQPNQDKKVIVFASTIHLCNHAAESIKLVISG
jgi:superfamily II DNA helicase RecQ